MHNLCLPSSCRRWCALRLMINNTTVVGTGTRRIHHAKNNFIRPRINHSHFHHAGNHIYQSEAMSASLGRNEKFEMKTERYFSSSSSTTTTTRTFTTSKSAESEEQMKKRCEALLHDNASDALKTKTVNSLLTDMAQFQQQPWVADYASKLLAKMWKCHDAGMEDIMPTKGTYNRVIELSGQSPIVTTRMEAVRYLDELEEKFMKTGHNHLRPDTKTYTILIDALSKGGERGIGEKASKILIKMERLYEKGDANVKPGTQTFGAVLNCLAKEGNATRAQAIVYHMEQLMRQKGFEDLRPDTITYSTLIDALAKSGERGIGEKAEAILSKMERLYREGDTNVKPNIRSFNAVLNCLAKEGNATRAQALVDHMEQLMRQKGFEDLRPNTITYSTLIDAWAKSGERGSGAKAEAILSKMERLYRDGDTNVKPDIWSFNAVLNCLAKEGNATRAQAIVDHMEQLMRQKGFEDLRPNTITYSTLIDALAKSGERGTGEKAEAILSKMERLYREGDTNVKPNIRSFNAVLNCLAKEGNATRAQAIVDHMEQLMSHEGFEDLRPNTITYSTLIDAWANSGNQVGVARVEAILNKMKDLKKNGDISAAPSIITYTSVMSMYQKSKENIFMKAVSLLNEMESLKQADPSLGPDRITYNTFLNIVAKSNHPKKVMLAENVLDKMKNHPDLYPGERTYDAVLRTCAYLGSKGHKLRRHALILACKILSEVQQSTTLSPSSHTYSFCFQAICNLSSGDELQKLMKRSFEDCCKAGLLNDDTLKSLRRVMPTPLLKALLNTDVPLHQLRVKDLPASWSRNALGNAKKGRKRF